MRDVFPEYYQLSDPEITDLWNSCIFVLDANVLLALYRLPREGRDDLLKILTTVKSRIWVPYQAAMEFHRNRLSVISEQRKVINETRQHINKTLEDLRRGLTKHLVVEAEPVMKDIEAVLQRYAEKLTEIEGEQADVHEDTVGNQLAELLSGRIGSKPTQGEIAAIDKEGEVRFQNSIPPGFKDAEKLEVFFFQGVKYLAKFGDLYLWKQVLMHLDEKQRHVGVIFVSDDRKDDWWVRSGGKTVGALPELRSEAQQAGAVNFHMYTLPNFLSWAKKHLDQTIRKESIEQAADLYTDEPKRPNQRYWDTPAMGIRCDPALGRKGMRNLVALMESLFDVDCRVEGDWINVHSSPKTQFPDPEMIDRTLGQMDGVAEIVHRRPSNMTWPTSARRRQMQLKVIPSTEVGLFEVVDRVESHLSSFLRPVDVSLDAGNLVIPLPENTDPVRVEFLQRELAQLFGVDNVLVEIGHGLSNSR